MERLCKCSHFGHSKCLDYAPNSVLQAHHVVQLHTPITVPITAHLLCWDMRLQQAQLCSRITQSLSMSLTQLSYTMQNTFSSTRLHSNLGWLLVPNLACTSSELYAELYLKQDPRKYIGTSSLSGLPDPIPSSSSTSISTNTSVQIIGTIELTVSASRHLDASDLGPNTSIVDLFAKEELADEAVELGLATSSGADPAHTVVDFNVGKSRRLGTEASVLQAAYTIHVPANASYNPTAVHASLGSYSGCSHRQSDGSHELG